MLRFLITLLSTIAITLSVFSQGVMKSQYELDSLSIYNKGKQEYTFYLKGGTQGLYIENYTFGTEPRILINIVNNTPDTLINNYKARDCGVLWLEVSLRYGDKINPGDTIQLYSAWLKKMGSFRCPLYYRYTLRDSMINATYRIWGNISKEKEVSNAEGVLTEKRDTILVNNGYASQDEINSHSKDKLKDAPRASKITYHPNGFIKTEIYPMHEYHYSEEKNGQIIKHIFGDSEYTAPVVYNYKDGEIYSKTSPKFINRKTYKIPYTVSKGIFKKEDLYEGEIEFYNTDDEHVISTLVKNGIQQEGFFYKGERYNLKDSLGQKDGKWIALHNSGGLCTHYSIADYGCKYISGIETYKNGVHTDTTYNFYKSGKLRSINIYPEGSAEQTHISYREDGSIQQVSTCLKTDSSKFTYEIITRYSDSLPNCIVTKTIGKKHKSFIDYTYSYKNCQVYSRTSNQKEIFYDTTQSVFLETFNDEQVYIKKEIGFNTRRIPFTVEIGEFEENEIYMINGIIEYYSEHGVFIERKKVLDGIIIGDE